MKQILQASKTRIAKVAAEAFPDAPDILPGPVTEEVIQEAEQRLGVQSPESYRLFLTEMGAVDFSFEVFGLGPEDQSTVSYWDVVVMTESERYEVEPALQHHLVPINPNGSGDHWCLDTSQIRDGDCPVVFWSHENGPDQKPHRTNDTFLGWLASRVDDEEAEYKKAGSSL